MRIDPRGARRASLALALGLTGLAATAPTALANASVSFGTGPDGAGASYSDDSSTLSAPSVDLLRGGSSLGHGDGFAWGGGRFANVVLPQNTQLVAGDQLVVTRDGTTQTFTYDGLPTINADACAGATSFTGTATSGATSLELGAYTVGLGSGLGENRSTVERSGTAFTARLARALTAGDFLFADETMSQNGVDVFQSTLIKAAATCPAPAATPAPAPAPKPTLTLPTATQIIAGLQATLGTQAATLAKLDIAKVAAQSAVNIPFTFLVPGTVKFTWTVASGAGARAAKKAKALNIASGKATRSTPGAAKVKVKVNKAGKKLLRHAKKVRITFTAAFTPAGGGPVQASQTKFTLKKHKKAKKKHSKKH